jgi:hypothetical protein
LGLRPSRSASGVSGRSSATTFAQDVPGLLAASQSSLYVLSTLGLVALVGVMGLWLLWQDHWTFRADRLAAASDISDPKPA